MANDAFALSPMTASGTLPSETDYEAISEAFMETARGRWFLKEYARRNRNADTAMVLEAVSRIETTMVAQKRQAPVPELAGMMEQIRTIIDEARTLASGAIDQLSKDETFTPSRRGVRIIQEVAWRLREIGYDARICDILESQANAINANHDALVTQDTHAAVLAAFDRIAQQIDNLVNYGVIDPVAAAQAATKPAPPPADLAEARLAREKSQSGTVMAGQPSPQSQQREVVAAVQPPSTDPASSPGTTIAENVVSLTSAKLTVQTQLEEAAENFAFERAAPENPSLESAIAPVSSAAVSLGIGDGPPKTQTDIASKPDAQPGAQQSAEAPREAAPTDSQSLGASLLTRGVVTVPGAGKSDPLAPINRMTQAEKIAFFS